jgi:DNA-directed RNA polymerase specialized sigma24 family protein
MENNDPNANVLVCPVAVALEKERFDEEVSELQNANSSSGRLLYVFVRRSLRSFNLDKNYAEAFLLNEAYLRGVSLINKGEVIQNIPAWYRKTIYNIVRELKREQQKTDPFEDHMMEVEQPQPLLEELDDDLKTLHLALESLDDEDKQLLHLKIIENLPWREIKLIMRLQGAGDYPEATWRKRKERALIKLRKKYHELKPY